MEHYEEKDLRIIYNFAEQYTINIHIDFPVAKNKWITPDYLDDQMNYNLRL